MPDTLAVRLYGEHVADILDAGFGLCGIRYTARAQALGAGARLSLSLPVRAETYPAAGPAQRWLRALLPEGRALQAAVEQYDVPADDVFSLLSVLGRDVAGATVIAPPGDPAPGEEPGYLPLSREQLHDLVAGVREHPLGLDRARGVRLSLAGVQDKLVLHRPVRSRQWYQPINGAPSTVIVKPQPPQDAFPGLPENEALCLTLARRAGLQAAAATVTDIGSQRCLVVRRYDRVARPGGVERVHQEDLLAALGRDPWLKYEGRNTRRIAPEGGFAELAPVRTEPGPGLDELAALIDVHLGKAGLVPFLLTAAFNVLIGNADAHARNLSLLLEPDGGVRLAPLYDLVCTRAYPELEREAAQRVNGVEDIDAIGVDDLRAHGAGWDLPSPVLDGVPALIAKARDALPGAVHAVVRNGGDPAHTHRVAELIRLRAERLLAS